MSKCPQSSQLMDSIATWFVCQQQHNWRGGTLYYIYSWRSLIRFSMGIQISSNTGAYRIVGSLSKGKYRIIELEKVKYRRDSLVWTWIGAISKVFLKTCLFCHSRAQLRPRISFGANIFTFAFGWHCRRHFYSGMSVFVFHFVLENFNSSVRTKRFENSKFKIHHKGLFTRQKSN